jgi:hypothetical protein
VGRAVVVGVRVQVGTGVRVMVGVIDSATIKVLLCCVRMAKAVPVWVSIPTQEVDNEPVVARGEGVTVPVVNSASVDVCTAGISSVCEARGGRVEVQGTEATVGTVVGALAWVLNGLTKTMAPIANNTRAREKNSHCLPAAILAWRVR